MKTLGLLSVLFLMLIVGGFAYIAMTDISVEQTTITKDIPTENLK